MLKGQNVHIEKLETFIAKKNNNNSSYKVHLSAYS